LSRARAILVAHLKHLALSCLPEVRAKTVVLQDDEKPGATFTVRGVQRIVDLTDDLLRLGVTIPMRILDAQRIAPWLSVAIVKKSRVERALHALAESLIARSPIVEALPPASIAVDLTGLARSPAQLARDVQDDLMRAGQRDVVVVVAPSKGLARALALDAARAPQRYRRRSRFVVEQRHIGHALARLGVESLGLDVDVTASLQALGVKSAADLARLVPAGVAARLRGDARAALRLIAQLKDDGDGEPLDALRPAEHIDEDVDLDDAIEALEPLGFLLAPLCDRVAARARARTQKIAGVVVTLTGRDLPAVRIPFEFPAPLYDSKPLFRAIMTRLDKVGVPGPVESLRILVHKLVDGRQRQADAFLADAAPPAAVAALLAELRAERADEQVAGCLRMTSSLLPEEMTALAWPAVPTEPAEAGLFLAGWPWPVRLLRASITVGDVVTRTPLCRIETATCARDYAVLVLRGGRRALAYVDAGDGEEKVQGWFD
jgi:hypothetical protein